MTTDIKSASDNIIIQISSIRNLRTPKSSAFKAVIRLDHNDKFLGESAKVDFTGAGEVTEVNFQCQLPCISNDISFYDEIASKPIIVTVVEYLPKEKKQKEEKTTPFGNFTIDLLPLLRGETRINGSYTIYPLPGSFLETLPQDQTLPEVDVQISVSNVLLSPQEQQRYSIFRMTVESLNSPPETWSPNSSALHNFGVAFGIPSENEKDQTASIIGGQMRPAGEKHIQKRWTDLRNAYGGATYIPNCFLSTVAAEDEEGDLKTPNDMLFRAACEKEKLRVVWNAEKRMFLDQEIYERLKKRITQHRYLPVEVFRVAPPTVTKKGKEEELNVQFHGVAYVNFSPLLYPGITRIKGVYKVVPYSQAEMQEKAGKKSIIDEASRLVATSLAHTAATPVAKKGDKEKGDKAGKKPTAASSLGYDNENASQSEQYAIAKTYITLEFELSRPLIPKKTEEELGNKIADYVPPRPKFAKRKDGAQRAVDDYQSQLTNVASVVLDEYRVLLEKWKGDETTLEQRRQRLLYELNSTGKYFAFKEQLKNSVVKIVREKYLRTTTFATPEELQAFLSELYVYLMDQLHVALNRFLNVADIEPLPEPEKTSEQLKHFAKEAELNGDHELAAKYHQERIARDKNDKGVWLDYGCYCLGINDYTKAAECFKEALSLEPSCVKSLLLCGIIHSIQDNYEAADAFFEMATGKNPKWILTWVIRALHFETTGDDIRQEMCLKEANKLSLKQSRKKSETDDTHDVAKESASDLSVPQIRQIPASPHEAVAEDGKVSRKASPASPLAARPGTVLAAESETSVKKEVQQPEQPAHSKTKLKPVVAAASPLKKPAAETSERCERSIYMIAAEFLLENRAHAYAEKALAHSLLELSSGSSNDYYLAVSKLHLNMGDLDKAEESLNKALSITAENSNTWSLLGHVKFLQGVWDEARTHYERTVSFFEEPEELYAVYLRLGSIYLNQKKFQEAKTTFLKASKRFPSCVSWLGLGIGCYRLDELENAEVALAEANILHNYEPSVWAYLSLICLRTGRSLEAEQSFKYCCRLNLQDEELLAEIRQLQQQLGIGNPSF